MYGHLVMNLSAAQRSRVTVIGLIDARTSGAIAVAEQSISATGAPAHPAGLLGCPPGAPVLRMDRLYRDTGSS
jgi:GntR family transcriptional regulator